MNKKQYDFLGKELNIGDNVVFVQINYRNLLKGTIKTMAPKSVLISHGYENNSETRQRYEQIIKI